MDPLGLDKVMNVGSNDRIIRRVSQREEREVGEREFGCCFPDM